MAVALGNRRVHLTLVEKLRELHWPLVALVLTIGLIGYSVLYSAAGGSHSPWAFKHGLRLVVGIGFMVVVALVDIRVFFRWAYVFFGVVVALLVAVDVMGQIRKGAERWLDLGIVQLQPSEMMKIALILALARYFHGAYLSEVKRPLYLVPPILMIFVPVGLVLLQPDLGTAIMLGAAGTAILFLAGVRLWKFLLVGAAAAVALPIAWASLHDYQKQRVYTFLDPENDPLGTGYHIIQSKIALGSGGFWGKGYLHGTQAQLSFLPEKHTDFAFTSLAEEGGFVSAVLVLMLFCALLMVAIRIAMTSQNHFGRLMAMGVCCNTALYVFINVAMVTGLIPVVGIPLPLISYGGTAMITVLFGFGLLLNVDVHRNTVIPRFPTDL